MQRIKPGHALTPGDIVANTEINVGIGVWVRSQVSSAKDRGTWKINASGGMGAACQARKCTCGRETSSLTRQTMSDRGESSAETANGGEKSARILLQKAANLLQFHG